MSVSRHWKGLSASWLFYIVLVIAFNIGGVKMTRLSRDPLQFTDGPFYTGLLSNMGVLMWWGAAVVSLFAAAVTGIRRPGATGARFLLHLGILTAVLALDDFLMIHEVVLPTYLHLPEVTMHMSYISYLGFIGLRFRRHILERTEYRLFVLAFVLLGLSVGVDLDYFPGGIDIEDGFKLLGITTYAYYCMVTAGNTVRDAAPELAPR